MIAMAVIVYTSNSNSGARGAPHNDIITGRPRRPCGETKLSPRCAQRARRAAFLLVFFLGGAIRFFSGWN